MEKLTGNNKEKISLNVFLIGIFLVFIIKCNDKFLGITNYFYLPIIIIIISILKMIMKRKLGINIEHICCILALIYILAVSLIYSFRSERGIVISYIIFITMFFATTLISLNKKEIKFIINSYILSAMIISLNILIFRNEFDGWVGTYRYTYKFSENLYVDPNFMAAFLVTPTILAFNKYLKAKSISNILIFITLVIGICLTGSRAGFLSVIIGLILLAFNYKKIRFIIVGAVVGLIIGCVAYSILPEGTVERLLFDSYVDGSNITRINNWKHAIKVFELNPLFGGGFLNTENMLVMYTGYNHAAHNTYLALLIQFGIIGIIPIAIIIIKIIMYSLKKRFKLLMVIFYPMLFNSIMIEQNVGITFWINCILAYMIINYLNENEFRNINDVL